MERGHFPAGVHLVSLSKLDQIASVEAELRRTVAAMETEWGAARGLLLLDGCDWLMEECSELLADWVSRTLQTTASVMLTATRDVAGICGVTQVYILVAVGS